MDGVRRAVPGNHWSSNLPTRGEMVSHLRRSARAAGLRPHLCSRHLALERPLSRTTQRSLGRTHPNRDLRLDETDISVSSSHPGHERQRAIRALTHTSLSIGHPIRASLGATPCRVPAPRKDAMTPQSACTYSPSSPPTSSRHPPKTPVPTAPHHGRYSIWQTEPTPTCRQSSRSHRTLRVHP